ncbi:hypothetical protein C1H46_040524 [Malus baccata]|uniref:Uncharacterized protein n=1 Tax=Malus baccata TaxID=106549 RepID=A0A540KIC5_MALBA|nr:hypothetical protein C1H46_040524 [Malus baccata]
MSLAVEPTNQACSDGHKPQTHRMRTGGTATAGNRAFRDEHSRRIPSSLRLRDLIQFPDPQEAKVPQLHLDLHKHGLGQLELNLLL